DVCSSDLLAGGTGNETGQAAARSAREPQRRDRRLHRAGGDVDDAPPAPLYHAGQNRGDQIDRGEHVGSERVLPVLFAPLVPHPRRRSSGVGDQDVRRGGRIEKPGRPSGVVTSPATGLTSTP